MTLRFLSLRDIRLNLDACECGHARGTIEGAELDGGDIVVITDHPTRPAFRVEVALDDSAIVSRVYLGPMRSIVPDYPEI